MACRTMQLRFFKLGTVLTYAFKVPGSSGVLDLLSCAIWASFLSILIQNGIQKHQASNIKI